MKTTQTRKDWATARGATMQGTPLIPPQEAERLYRTAMQKAIQRMVKAYGKELEATIKPFATAADAGLAMDANLGSQLDMMFGRLNKHWGKVFGKLARTLAKTTVSRVDRLSKRRLDQSLKELSGGLTIKTPDLPESMISTLQAATARNVGLIKSIQSKFHDQIAQEVLNNIGDQQSVFENAKKLVSRVYFHGETTEERARLIARDQVAKMSSEMSAARAKSAGITKFKWRHSGGSADPRKLHLDHNNKIFSYDDLPVIDERTGEKGLPGQAINCRCVAIPVIDFG
jgi:SPP1 gp7 family putative phage head morphogenesis protein